MIEIIIWSGAIIGGLVALVWCNAVRDRAYDARVIEALGDGEMRGRDLKYAGVLSVWNCYPVLASMADRGLLTVRRSARGAKYYRVFRGYDTRNEDLKE